MPFGNSEGFLLALIIRGGEEGGGGEETRVAGFALCGEYSFNCFLLFFSCGLTFFLSSVHGG